MTLCTIRQIVEENMPLEVRIESHKTGPPDILYQGTILRMKVGTTAIIKLNFNSYFT